MGQMDEQVVSAGLTRRRFLQVTGAAGVAAFLAACAGGTGSSEPTATDTAGASIIIPTPPPASPTASVPATPKAVTGPLEFANWGGYIDVAGNGAAGGYAPGSHPTLVDFQKKFGIQVDYEEKINDNPSFLATITPALSTGVPTGWDLIVMTDSFAAEIISKGWAEKIDHANVPNCTANLRQELRNQAWDMNNDYHYPWQSGMTGIGYNKKALSQNKIAAPTKLADLWNIDPNKVEFLTEARDTFGLTLLKLGIDPNPATVTVDNLQAVHDDIEPLVSKGLLFLGQDYLAKFGAGGVWAGLVWSGDLANSGNSDDLFVFPEEGTMIWTDNMLIPKGAPNKYTAELMMNYVYDPVVAAKIADYVFYVSPVEGAADEIKKIDPSAATNPLLFPAAADVAKQRNFQFLSPDLEDSLNSLMADLTGR
jgi:spermidine/putrescine transport system substrate-binding protein